MFLYVCWCYNCVARLDVAAKIRESLCCGCCSDVDVAGAKTLLKRVFASLVGGCETLCWGEGTSSDICIGSSCKYNHWTKGILLL